MIILSIESSCDETAAAVVKGRQVLSNVVNTQIEEHIKYGGVVPEIASRRHCENISLVVEKAVNDANISFEDIEAVAVTFAPGLIGSLLVGVNYAKGLAMRLGVPLIPVHHLRSHIAANYIAHPELEPPFLCLLVSGGNTILCEVKGYTEFNIIGQTRDDAAGECLDKAARCMGLNYPGGVNLDKIATIADPVKYPLPTPKIDNKYDFSFSGLKTAVINTLHNAEQKGEKIDIPVFAATLRKKVCDILIDATLSAAKEFSYTKIAVAGGVSANSELRARLEKECGALGYKLYFPPLSLCGDNAAMVGAQAIYEFENNCIAKSDLNAYATYSIDLKE